MKSIYKISNRDAVREHGKMNYHSGVWRRCKTTSVGTAISKVEGSNYAY